jgi:hypothetical protein
MRLILGNQGDRNDPRWLAVFEGDAGLAIGPMPTVWYRFHRALMLSTGVTLVNSDFQTQDESDGIGVEGWEWMKSAVGAEKVNLAEFGALLKTDHAGRRRFSSSIEACPAPIPALLRPR